MSSSQAMMTPNQQTSLVALAETDLSEVSGFIARESGREQSQVEAHLRWFLLENPARDSGSPLGFGLRSEKGDLVGCLLCSPQKFRFQQQQVPVMGSSCFYVNEAYRGSGALIFLKYSRLSDRWPLFGNSANAEAATLWKGRGAAPIPNSDRELIGVLQWSPVVEDLIYKKVGRSAAPRLTASLTSGMVSSFRRLKLPESDSADLHRLGSADHAAQLCDAESPAFLTAVRDASYLRWRYFSERDATAAVFAFRAGQLERPVLVTVNQRPRGYRGQINALYVLDIYPQAPAELLLQIASALGAHYHGKVDVIVLRCLDPAQRDAACKTGFIERRFDAPNGWFLDKRGLLPTRDWHTVPADGDWVI